MRHILLAEDDPMQRLLMQKLLEKQLGYRVTVAQNGAEALYHLKQDADASIDLALLDLDMPEMDGREALAALKAERSALPVVILTAQDGLDTAVELMKAGAADFLTKPAELLRLRTSLENALRLSDLGKEVERLHRKEQGAAGFGDVIGARSGLKKQVKLAKRAAGSDITVMLTGESGTGKEVLAEAIHGASQRAGKPFVTVNCGAIPKNLAESTLFGHVKGAFTGATGDALGKFREADGGTLFLDEVGELPLATQVKLLRVLQQREVEPVGAGQATPVNVRIIAATNRDLRREVAAGHFREDVFYRLHVFPVHLPPLRSRKEDVLRLAEHFLHRYAALEALPATHFSEEAEAWLMAHEWPGNVRELENAVYRATLMSEGETIQRVDLGVSLQPSEGASEGVEPASPSARPHILLQNAEGTCKEMAQLKREIIQHVLAGCGGNISEAARQLHIGKATIYRQLQ